MTGEAQVQLLPGPPALYPELLKCMTLLGGSVKFVVTLEDGEDGYIVVSCPALPGCHSQGESKEEAIANIKEAIEGFIASMREQGEAIPMQVVEEVEVAV